MRTSLLGWISGANPWTRTMLLSVSLTVLGCSRNKGQPPPSVSDSQPGERISVGKFTAADLKQPIPKGWKELTFDPEKFPRISQYEVVRMGSDYVLKASTRGGVSAIYKTVSIDPKKYPYLVWRWRVDQIYEKANEKTKEGDDYPARVYVAFRYNSSEVDAITRLKYSIARKRSKDDEYPPLYVLNYVWGNTLKKNTWMPNPWAGRSKMIAVKSGAEGLGQWHTEVRDYLRDYRAIIGEDPPPVDYIAIMIDGDGTKSTGVSYFADIELRSHPPPGIGPDSLRPPTKSAR